MVNFLPVMQTMYLANHLCLHFGTAVLGTFTFALFDVWSTTNLEPGMRRTSASGKSEYAEMSMPLMQCSKNSVRSPCAPKKFGFISTSEFTVVEVKPHQNSSLSFGYSAAHSGSRFGNARHKSCGQAFGRSRAPSMKSFR